jgi:hypothetical protein
MFVFQSMVKTAAELFLVLFALGLASCTSHSPAEPQSPPADSTAIQIPPEDE